MPYEKLKADALSAVIEDATDAIANGCNGGLLPKAECVQKMGWIPPDPNPDEIPDKEEV